MNERLAGLEVILLRIETRAAEDRAEYRDTVNKLAERIAKLERAWSYVLGTGAGLGASTALYLKSLFK